MEPEHLVASILGGEGPAISSQKDGAIFVYQWRPFVSQEHALKKSSTAKNSLAVTDTHVFAAQADKAVVNVYSLVKNNLEATVPFPEKITSIAAAGNTKVLILGTATGRILLWEICSGRLVSTPEAHLGIVTTLAVDPTSNFLLSASEDASLHVWSLNSLLDFSRQLNLPAQMDSKPLLHTVEHQSAVRAIACGHSHGSGIIAVSASENPPSAMVWDLRKGTILRTYLLNHTPTALAMDVLDRGFYVAYFDGSVQLINFFDTEDSSIIPVQDTKHMYSAINSSPKNRWTIAGSDTNAENSELNSALCLLLSRDGTRLLSGHKDGTIASWQVATGSCEMKFGILPGPVSNLISIPSATLSRQSLPKITIDSIVKPRPGSAGVEPVDNGLVPDHYAPVVQFSGLTSDVIDDPTENCYNHMSRSQVEQAMIHSSFPVDIQEEGLAELANWNERVPSSVIGTTAKEKEFMALDEGNGPNGEEETPSVEGTLRNENETLKDQVAALQRLQRVSFMQLRSLREEKRLFLEQKQAADERHVEDQKALQEVLEARSSSANIAKHDDREDQNPQKKRKLENS